MDLLYPEVLDEASCIVTTFQTLEFNFIGQGQYDYNERYPIFFDCTHLCLPLIQTIFQLFCHLCHNARMNEKTLVIGHQTHNWE
jgi:hypothetical protein